MEAEKEMLRYVRGSMTGNLLEIIIGLPIVAGLVGGIIHALLSFIGEAHSGKEFLLSVLITLVGIIFLRHWLHKFMMPYLSYLYFWKTISSLKNTGMYDSVILDFVEAVPVLKDCIRLGRQYIFCKSTWIIIAYKNINNIHQYVVYTNRFETNRELRIVDKQNRTRMICKLKLWRRADDELQKVIRFILQKNPYMTVGYSK